MATVTATRRSTSGNAKGFGGGGVKNEIATIELAAAASGTVIDFGITVPTNARILGASRIYHDDLATSGSPTLDLGLYSTSTNVGSVTSDDDALTDGVAVSAVMAAPNAGVLAVKDFTNFGKRAWEYVSGLSADPQGNLAVKGVTRDAATTATGTVTLDLYYTLE